MPALDDLKTRIRAIMAVGNSLDTMLDDFVRDAVMEIEGAIDLPYQRKRLTKTISQSDRLLISTDEIKRVCWARRVVTENGSTQYYPIPLVQEWQAEETGPGTPLYAWFNSQNTFEFDLSGPAPATHDVEVQVYIYSAWPLAEGSPLFTRYRRLLLIRSIMETAVAARKPELLSTYQGLYTDAMLKLQVAADAVQGDFAEVYMGGSR